MITEHADALLKKRQDPRFWFRVPPRGSSYWRIWNAMFGIEYPEGASGAAIDRTDDAPEPSDPTPLRETPALHPIREIRSDDPLIRDGPVQGWVRTFRTPPEFGRHYTSDAPSGRPHRILTLNDLTPEEIELIRSRLLARSQQSIPTKYMSKRMEPVEVGIGEDGVVVLTSFDKTGHPQVIRLHPAQIDLLCEWLKDAKEEVEETVRQSIPRAEER